MRSRDRQHFLEEPLDCQPAQVPGRGEGQGALSRHVRAAGGDFEVGHACWGHCGGLVAVGYTHHGCGRAALAPWGRGCGVDAVVLRRRPANLVAAGLAAARHGALRAPVGALDAAATLGAVRDSACRSVPVRPCLLDRTRPVRGAKDIALTAATRPGQREAVSQITLPALTSQLPLSPESATISTVSPSGQVRTGGGGGGAAEGGQLSVHDWKKPQAPC